MGKKKITKNALIFFGGTLCSRILGFIRDILIAQYFGATPITDSFFVAFRIPNLLRRLVGEGALSSAFIPVFAEMEAKGENLRKVFNSAFSSLILILTLILLIGEGYTSGIVSLVSPGFSKNPKIMDLTIHLTKITFPYIFFIGLCVLLGAILNYKGDFFYTSISPVFLNISFIFFILFLRNCFSNPIFSLAWAVIVGGVLQLAFHLYGTYKLGTFPNPACKPFSKPVKKALKLMAPATIGLAVHQINTFIDTIIASFLTFGSISYLYYANRLFQLPLALFGIAVGSAMFPEISKRIHQGQIKEAIEDIRYSLGLISFITVPATLGLIIFAPEIVDFLFRRGAFTHNSVLQTAFALRMYAVGLIFFSAIKIVVNVYYACQDMTTPVKASVLALMVNIIGNIIFMLPLKHAGLALATSLAAIAQLSYLSIKLKDKAIKIRDIIPSSIYKIAITNLILAFFMLLLKLKIKYNYYSNTLVKLAFITTYIFSSLVIYMLLSLLTKVEELKTFRKLKV